MTGFACKLSEVKKERLRRLTKDNLATSVIAERLGMKMSQVYYHQQKLGIWKGKKRK